MHAARRYGFPTLPVVQYERWERVSGCTDVDRVEGQQGRTLSDPFFTPFRHQKSP
jgi:hypothetical protein